MVIEKTTVELEEKGETKLFSTNFIKERIKTLLVSNKNIKEVTNLDVAGFGGEITLSTTVVAKKGILTPVVGVKATLENKDGTLVVKNYKIDANVMIKGTVEDLIVPELNEVSEKVKGYIEKEEGKRVEKIEIVDGMLLVSFITPKTKEVKPITPVVFPEAPKSEFVASVPIMITRDMTQQLLDLGWSKEEINSLKPEKAGEIIKEGKKRTKPITITEPTPIETMSPETATQASTELSNEEKDKLIKAVLKERGRVKDELLSNFDLDGLKKELKRKEERLDTLQNQEEKDSLEGFISIIKDVIGELEKGRPRKPEIAPKNLDQTPDTVPATTTETTPPETIPVPMLDVEKKLVDARTKYAEEYKKFLASTGKIARAKRFIFGAKTEDFEIPPELKELEKEYERATVELGQKMYRNEEDRLSKDISLSDDEKKSSLERFKQTDIFTTVIIAEQFKLNALKIENPSSEEKKIVKLIKKGWGWYTGLQPSWKKLAISTVLGGFAFAAMPGTAITAGGMGAYLAIRTARGVAGITAAKTTAKVYDKAYDWLFKEKAAAKRKKQEEELSKLFKEETFDTGFAKSKEEYAKILERERKAKRNRLVTKALLSMAAGGAASIGTGYGMGQILHPPTGNLDTSGTHQPDVNETLHKANVKLHEARLKAEIDAKNLGNTQTAPATSIPDNIKPEEIAIVGKGEGIENAFRRQIEADTELARSLGFKGDVNDLKALHEFSGGAAHRVALGHGYIDKVTGEEIRVKTAGEVAYRLKLENGELKVDEMKAGGGLVEGHGKGSEFEKDTEDYEYKGRTIHKPGPEDLGAPKSSESFHFANERPSELGKFGNVDLVGEHLEPNYQESAEVIAARGRVLAGMEEKGRQHFGDALHKNVATASETIPTAGGTSLLQEYRDIIKNHPEFAKYSKDFTPVKLVEFYETHKGNTNFIFRNDASDSWEKLKDLKAISVLDQTGSNDPATRHLAEYIRLVRRYTGLDPKAGWFVFGKGKTAEEYIVDGLKILMEERKLGQFEAALRK